VTFEQDARVGFVSGWSTRGLNKPANKNRILDAIRDQLLRDDLEHCVVFFAFGSVDVEWNLAFKRTVQNEHPDTEEFLGQMRDSFTAVLTEALALGEQHKGTKLKLVLMFPFAPLPLTDDYIHRTYAHEPPTYDMIPRNERLSMWKGFVSLMGTAVNGLDIPIVDITPTFEAKGAEIFMNDEHEDHHPDFIKTQTPLAELIADLQLAANVAPRPPLHELYAHVRRRMGIAAEAAEAQRLARVAATSKPENTDDICQLSSSPDDILELGQVLIAPPKLMPSHTREQATKADETAVLEVA